MSDQRIALVTGGAGGLGSAICNVLSEEGGYVYVLDQCADRTEAVCRAINQQRGRCATPVICDLSQADAIVPAVTEIAQRHGRIDVLVNNAGIDQTVSVEEMSLEAWDRILAINLRAPFILSRAVLPGMRERRKGDIINIISTAALRAWPNASAYHASKWGLLGFSHALHTEARADGVRVTGLIAGGMRTPFLTDRFPDIDQETLQEPRNVAEIVRMILRTPEGSVIPQVSVLPMKETSWP